MIAGAICFLVAGNGLGPDVAGALGQNILGMGDVVTLVEKAQEHIDEKDAAKMAEKLRKADFNLEDFLAQMQQMKKLGSMQSIMGMIPGMSGVELPPDAEKQMKRTEAIIHSMTIQERRKPDILNGRRRERIAKGSGVKIADVNQLIKQFQPFAGSDPGSGMAGNDVELGITFPTDSFAR